MDPAYVATVLFKENLLGQTYDEIGGTKIFLVELEECIWRKGILQGRKSFTSAPLSGLSEAQSGKEIKQLCQDIDTILKRSREARAQPVGQTNVLLEISEDHQLIIIATPSHRKQQYLSWKLLLPNEPGSEDLSEGFAKEWEQIGHFAEALYPRFRDACLSLALSTITSSRLDDRKSRIGEVQHILECARRRINDFMVEEVPSMKIFTIQPLFNLTVLDQCIDAIKGNIPVEILPAARQQVHQMTQAEAPLPQANEGRPVVDWLTDEQIRCVGKAQTLTERICAWMLQLIRYSHQVHMRVAKTGNNKLVHHANI